MSRRRSALGNLSSDLSPPGVHARIICWVFLGILFLALQGMVILFAGTRFWASAPFLSVILACGGIFCLLQPWWARGDPGAVHLSGEFWGLVAAASYAALRATLGSAVPYESWTEAYLLSAAAMLWLMFARLGSQKRVWLVLSGLFISFCVLHAMWAIRNYAIGNTSVLWLEQNNQYAGRAKGTFICPNHFAFLMQMAVIVSVGVLCMPRVRFSMRIVAAYAAVVCFSALALSFSRAGMLGVLAGLVVLLFFSPLRKHRKLFVSVMVGGALLGGLALWLAYDHSPVLQERFRSFNTTNIRWAMLWPDTWLMIQGEGIWGSGPGTYPHVFDAYREHFNIPTLYAEYAHNEYLHLLSEYGWIGFLLMVGAAGARCMVLFRAAWTHGGNQSGLLPAMMLALWVGALVHAVFDFQMHITAAALTWVMLLGTFHGATAVKGVWRTPPMPPRQTSILYGICGLFCLLMIWPSVRLGMGSYHGYRARLSRQERHTEQVAHHSTQQRKWLPTWYEGWRSLGQETRASAFWLRDREKKSETIRQSRNAYEQALQRNPYDRISRAGLIECYKMERRWEEALSEALNLEALSPFDFKVQVQKGLILKRMGRTQEALDTFIRADKLRWAPDRQIELNLRRLRKQLEEESSRIEEPSGLTDPSFT